jgi:hypothetical protein
MDMYYMNTMEMYYMNRDTKEYLICKRKPTL